MVVIYSYNICMNIPDPSEKQPKLAEALKKHRVERCDRNMRQAYFHVKRGEDRERLRCAPGTLQVGDTIVGVPLPENTSAQRSYHVLRPKPVEESEYDRAERAFNVPEIELKPLDVITAVLGEQSTTTELQAPQAKQEPALPTHMQKKSRSFIMDLLRRITLR
jgi:hypothetical protein